MDAVVHKALVQVKNVGLSYRQSTGFMRYRTYWALKDLSFDLYEGETLGVIGRNGVGKSTLLRLLAGVIEPNSGSITCVDGVNIALLSLQVGFNPCLTGRQNIYLSGIVQMMSRQVINDCLDEILSFSDLGDFIDQPVKTYSTGMVARLGFAIAMQANPDVLLIDEVLGVGDAVFKKKSTAMMKERVKSNHTVLIVSHNMPTIRELCDRVLWVEEGLVRMIGSTNEVLKQYLVEPSSIGGCPSVE